MCSQLGEEWSMSKACRQATCVTPQITGCISVQLSKQAIQHEFAWQSLPLCLQLPYNQCLIFRNKLSLLTLLKNSDLSQQIYTC